MGKIIRIEHPYDGKGVYHSVKAPSSLDYSSQLYQLTIHRPPEFDTELVHYFERRSDVINIDHWFGFSDWEQLRRWIFEDSFLIKLFELGFKILVIEAEVTYHGTYQAMFNKRFDYKTIYTSDGVDISQIEKEIKEIMNHEY